MTIWHLILILFVLMPGCAANPVAESTPASSETASSRSAEQLMELFQQAHEKRDVEAIYRLVYSEGVDVKTRESFTSGVSANFGLPVNRIIIEELSEDKKFEYTLGGVTYRPNLKPVGRLRVEFDSPAGGQRGDQTSGYLIGVKDGSHYIATAMPTSP